MKKKILIAVGALLIVVGGATAAQLASTQTITATITVPYSVGDQTGEVVVSKDFDVPVQTVTVTNTVTVTQPTTTTPPPPPADTQSPTVSMSAPTSGATVSGSITVSATASDNVGVAKVELYNDGRVIGTKTSAPYSVSVDTSTLANGSTTFGARAYDAAGNVGLAPQVTVTVNNTTTPPPPPPTTSGKLLWSPPALTNPTTVQVTNSNRYLDLDPTKDYIIKMPSTPLGRNSSPGHPALWIVGGRNVVLIGGEIKIDELASASLGSFNQRGIVISGNKGIVHIEGLWIHGAGLSNGVSFDNGRGAIGTVQIENTRIESVHPVWHTSEGDPVEVHPDSFQSWQGPEVLRLYQVTVITNGTLEFMLPRQYSRTQPLGQWDYRRLNMIHRAADSYALWKDTAVWPEYHEDIWLVTNPNHVASAFHSAWAGSGNCWTCWNPGGSWPITGEAIHIGLRPEGDFVPVGAAGIGYVSPGYKP